MPVHRSQINQQQGSDQLHAITPVYTSNFNKCNTLKGVGDVDGLVRTLIVKTTNCKSDEESGALDLSAGYTYMKR